jgi:hypothetical protein
VEAVWKVEGIGSAANSVAASTRAAGSGGNGAQPVRKSIAKPPAKVASKPAGKPAVKSPADDSATARVPFGRGPKGKSFDRGAHGKQGRR